MDNQLINLSICQVCKVNPAVYGDGVTFARCSKCEYEHNKEHPEEVIEPPVQTTGQGIPHQMIPGLVSIIMPLYNVNYALFHYTGNAIGSLRSHTKREKEAVKQYELI